MGPYWMDKIYLNGSSQLLDLEGHPLDTRVNASRVKCYRPKKVRKDAHGYEESNVGTRSHILLEVKYYPAKVEIIVFLK